MGVTTIINPLFNLALIPLTQHQYDNGAIGAALSLLLTEIVVVGAGIWLIGRRVFDGGSVRRASLGLVAATASGVATYLSQAMINWVVAAAIGILVFAGAAVLLRVFTPGEIELMRQGLQKVMRRIPGLKRFAKDRPRGPDPLLVSSSRESLDSADRPTDSPTEPLAGPERRSRDAAREAKRGGPEGLDAEPGGA
jgi:hypothetical protein